MDGWIALFMGVVILALVFSDRDKVKSAWRDPARWWSRDVDEYVESRAPSQPLNVVLGVALGAAAVIYGVTALLN